MPKTQSRFQQDLGFPDGIIPLSVNSALITGAAAAITRNGVGDISSNMGAAQTTVYSFNVAEGEILRTGFGEDNQMQFGGAGIAGSSQPQIYRPDAVPAMAALQELTPRTANKLKGIRFLGFAVEYLISGAALTAHTARFDQSAFANNVAIAVANLLAAGANGLATAIQANPYVTTILLPANQQIYRITDLSQLWFEISVTTQAGGAYRMYGVRALVEFNYN